MPSADTKPLIEFIREEANDHERASIDHILAMRQHLARLSAGTTTDPECRARLREVVREYLLDVDAFSDMLATIYRHLTAAQRPDAEVVRALVARNRELDAESKSVCADIIALLNRHDTQ